jgi:hypothetical protein
MSLLQSFKNLAPKTRLFVGAGLLAWGFVGLRLSDSAEERYGLKPTEEDREALRNLGPRLVTLDRNSDGADDDQSGKSRGP